MDETAETTELGLDNPNDPEFDASASANAGEHVGDAANGAQAAALENGNEGEPNEGAGEDEVEFQFGDEAAPASTSQEEAAPPWVKDLRKQFTQVQREKRELEAKLQQQQPQAPDVPTLGAKPKLEEFDYDEGKFEDALGKWFEKKREVDAAAETERKAGEARERANEERLAGYRTEASALQRKDFQDVESDVVAALTPAQQGIILCGADKPATLIYALGRFPTKLRDLAAIKDPVRFAFAAAKLEKELKVTTRTANKAAPEGRVESSAGSPAAGGGERKLEQLRAEAEKTGDYTKVTAYKRQMKQAQPQKRK